MSTQRSFSAATRSYIAAVVVLFVAGILLRGGGWTPPSWPDFGAALAIAAIFGLYPVRFANSSFELNWSYPLLVYSLAALPPRLSVVIVVVSVLGTVLPQLRRQRPIRIAFNVSAVGLAALVGTIVYEQTLGTQLTRLSSAAGAYLLINTGIVAGVVRIDRKDRPFLRSWIDAVRWTAPAALIGTALGLAMWFASDRLGTIGLGVVLAPCWVVLSFYRLNEARIEAERRRSEEVEALNGELSRTVDDLREALAHIKQLRGLIPICMHCKSIRDGDDVWHRLEAYLAEHSDASLTHSLCDSCREVHYPEVARKRRSLTTAGSED